MDFKYYEWTSLYDNPDISDDESFIIIEELKLANDLLDPDLMEGRFIDYWPSSNYALFSHSGAHLDILVQTLDIKIVSNRCRSILESKCENEIQALPIRLVHEKDKANAIEGYYAINNLVLLDCIDYNQTDFKYDEEEDQIYLSNPDARLYLHDSVAREHGIFRLKRHSITTILRSDVADALRDADITGLGLREICAT